MNKRILFGVLFLALGATCKVSLKAKSEGSTKLISQAPSSESWSMKKLIDNIKGASKSTPRTPISNEQQARDFFTPPARDAEKPSARASGVTREKIERESREAVQVSQPQNKADHIRTATEMTATTITPEKGKITREKSEGSSIERTRTERIAQENKAIFSNSSQVLAKEPKKKSAEAEDIGVVKKPKPTIVGDIEVPAGTKAPSADTVAGWKAEVDAKKEKATREKREVSSEERIKTERIAEENKATFSSSSQALAIRKPGDIVAVKPLDSVTGALVTTSKPLTPETGAIIPYTGKPSGPISVAADESKPGMSGKKKAALGAAAVGAGAAGVGAAALGAGLIGAGALGVAGAVGVGMSGDKDKPAPEIAPERVEDIKGLDAGSGLGESFEPSPIGG
ncbi:hypothetical protein JST56_01425 [Candidatus Dependentiae bacterium]|nr:hypothetical protein [Candidatus Dependentiae bacterium]